MKVVKVTNDSLVFDNGYILESEHESDCCEYHWLSFTDLTLEDFEDMEFDLSNDEFFEKIDGYGIKLIPTSHHHSVRVPGYGSNNGYYSTNLTLTVSDSNFKKLAEYDITECQVIDD